MANTQTPPLRMEVKFRNNIILKMMEKRGIKSVAELCRGSDLEQNEVGKLINMRVLPLNQDGSWRAVAIRLADFFDCLPEDMFSEDQLTTRLEKNRSFAEVTFAQVRVIAQQHEAEMMLPDKLAEATERKELIEYILSFLDKRKALVLKLRFGLGCDEHTLEEVAERIGVTRERVRQIENETLRHLRHPRYSGILRQCIGD